MEWTKITTDLNISESELRYFYEKGYPTDMHKLDIAVLKRKYWHMIKWFKL